jgi:arylsulfatase A-like enzyme
MTNRTPNILFIVADDLNAWIGALDGHLQTKTPNIDRLAARGLLFERAYCTAPYCNASRMSVFLGRQPSHSGIYHNETAEGRTYFEALREQGYHTASAGKVFHGTYNYAEAGRQQLVEAAWMPVHPQHSQWDEAFPIAPEPMPPARPLNRMFDFTRFDEVDPWNHLLDWGVLPEPRESETPDAQVVRAARAFLARPPPTPFLFAAGFYKPHLPWYAPQRFFDLHPLDEVILPEVRADELDEVPPIPRQWALNPPDHETILRHNQWRQAVQGYLAAISYCDAQIGRVLDALDSSPAADDTIIVLWGDNGFHLGEKLHWRKFALWEEATRVPLIIVPPRRSGLAPQRIADPVSLIDLFPTLFDMAGLEAPGARDGRSLLPLLRGNALAWPVLTTWRKGNHSLRVEHFRYTRYSDGTEEFYDHAADPRERRNLARLPETPAALIEARALLVSALETNLEA